MSDTRESPKSTDTSADHEAQQAVDRVMEGTTWFEFCDILKMAGYAIIRDSSPSDPFDRAEGFRYLSRITRAALEAFIERADPRFPVLYRPVHETVKMGADNPDNYYQHANISGQYDYRLWGRRGTINYLGFGTYAGDYGSGEPTGETGYLEGEDIQVGADGNFEVVLSCREQPGNWLPMTPTTTQLIVRQTFLDRGRETLADLHLERIGAEGSSPAPLSPGQVDGGLSQAARFVVGAASLFTNWAEGWAQIPNTLPRFDANESLAAHGDPNIVYHHGYWRLAPDEALVVEVTPPPCDYWNFQLCNHWMESLDYRFHRIAINQHEATYEPDGSVRVVVAHENPDVVNWLTTDHHRQGTMCWRWIRAAEHPEPATRVVKLADLRSEARAR